MITEVVDSSLKLEESIKIKHRGKVFTPDYLVNDILNQGHYVIGNINRRHVIDNSCGDGQFMVCIVDRYCKDFLSHSSDLVQLKQELEIYIHAIEIEKEEIEISVQRCEEVANSYGVKNVQWDFVNDDSMRITKYNGKMDFVLGNPPYVRVHNLDDLNTIKSYLFGSKGMTDLFIVFYELGLKMLNSTGILCYITPSSFFTSVAGSKLRKFITENKILESICDLKHFQPFQANTYTTIVCLNKMHQSDQIYYYNFDETNLQQRFIECLKKEDYLILDNFYFSSRNNLFLLKRILTNSTKADVSVKNGYATLSDGVFIGNFDFESKYIRPVLKSSTGEWKKIIFPYDNQGKLISENELSEDDGLYEYLLSFKDKLMHRSNEKDKNDYWYAFGRSQAIKDTFADRISINSLIRDQNDLKLIKIPSGCGSYSGLYIISKSISYEEIKKALFDKEFTMYISLLGKYKSGGYYTFSSKDLKIYLDYKLGSKR